MPRSPAAGVLTDHLPPGISTRRGLLCDGQDSLSGGELLNRVAVLASTINALGSRRAALIADNGIGWIIADLACQQANTILLPIPTFFSSGQIRHAMAEVDIDLLLVGKSLNASAAAGIADLIGPGSNPARRFPWKQYPATPEELEVFYRPPGAGGQAALPGGTGKITYTSGSTGNPKGVCLSHRQLIVQARALADTVDITGGRHLCLLPLGVLLENVAGVYTTLINGGSVIAPPLSKLGFRGSSSLEPKTLLAAIERVEPQTLILIPQLLVVLVQACENGWKPPSSLAFLAVGGARVAPGLIERARDLGLPVYEGYGLSECASVVSLNRPGHERVGSAGRPLPHVEVSCLNGEIHIAGNPFLGYVNDPGSWHPHRVASGDLGRLDSDGFLYLEGRRKNLLITAFGRNVSPEWVESELTASPILQEAVVFGDGKPWLTALVSPGERQIGDDTIDRWIQQVNAGLPDYARVRRWFRPPLPITATEGLTTATGKPRRDAVYRHFQARIDALYDEFHFEDTAP